MQTNLKDLELYPNQEQRKHMLLIKITQYAKIEGIPLKIDYYLSNLQDDSMDEIATHLESYLTSEKIYQHIQHLRNEVVVQEVFPQEGLRNYDFLTPIEFQGVVSDEIIEFSSYQAVPCILYTSILKQNEFGENIHFNSFFHEKVSIFGEFIKPLMFQYANFKNEVIFQAQILQGGINFAHCRFKKKAMFSNLKIGRKYSVNFERSTFEDEANFSSTHFEGDTYFHRVTFKKRALFYRSRFSQIANFYFATFENIPNFSMCVFENPKLINFIGIDSSRIILKALKEEIQTIASQESQMDENKYFGRSKQYLKIQHALNILDSFRVIKDTLNTQSNLFESQKWHKLELYAKEIELGYRLQTKSLQEESQDFSQIAQQDTINNQLAYKQQKLYLSRITQNDSQQMLAINQTNQTKNLIDWLVLCFYRHTSDHHTDLLKILSWIVCLIGGFGFSLFVVKFWQSPQILDSLNPYGLGVSAIGFFVFWILFAFVFPSFRWFCVAISSICVAWIVCYKPKLIFGVLNLIGESQRNGVENVLYTLYTLLAILLLFSLQKTARKNSIIPT